MPFNTGINLIMNKIRGYVDVHSTFIKRWDCNIYDMDWG